MAVRQLWRVLFHLAAAAAVSVAVAAGCRVVSFSLASLLTESIQYISSFESAVSQMLNESHCREMCGSLQDARRITIH